MLEKLKEFKDSLTERIRSPFIGNFMITWSLLHWKIILLTLFNEDNLSIKNRIENIEAYLSTETFCSLILYPVLITLFLLVGYSILNGLGLSIKLFYDNWISTFVQKILNNDNIIQKDKYDKLKRQYNIIKKEFEEEKNTFIDTEKERRELKEGIENMQQNWFEGKIYSDISFFLSKDDYWYNTHKYPDGNVGNEYFTTKANSLILTNGESIEIDNIKASLSGKILFFNKVFPDKIVSNYLIKDKQGNYFGVENNDIIISYIKKLYISITSATYGGDGSFVDVTEQVVEIAKNNKNIISATNEIYGDPLPYKQKKLNINYTINGIENNLIITEGQTGNLETKIIDNIK